ncbi:MAG: hypothetical protein JST04_04045 [Bdellovibrionales bacterium]|nr:hypothetical protein [Bdellovibrionales bacterium]
MASDALADANKVNNNIPGSQQNDATGTLSDALATDKNGKTNSQTFTVTADDVRNYPNLGLKEGQTVTVSKKYDGSTTVTSNDTATGTAVRKTISDGTVTKSETGTIDPVSGGFHVDGTTTYGDSSSDAPTWKFSNGKDTFETSDPAKAQEAANSGKYKSATMTKDGQSYKIDPRTGNIVVATEEKKNQKVNKDDAMDDCVQSLTAARDHVASEAELSRFRCNGTKAWVKGSEIANQVLSGTGRNVVNQMGAQSAAQAQNGSFIDAQKGAAKMAKTGFTYETALGIANLAATAKLASAANKHKQNAAEMAAWQAQAKAAGGNISTFGNANGAVADLQNSKDAQSGLDAALIEQRQARDLASTAALKTAMQAAQSIAAATVAKKSQKAAEANARLAQQAQDQLQANSFKYDPNQLAPPTSNAYDPNQMAATSGTDSTTASTSSDGSTTGLDDMKLTDGSDSGAGSDAINAPNAGAFKSGATGGPGGGGAGAGAPSAGGGGSSGGPTAAEDPKAAYASEFGTKERYETGGGLTGAGGAKGGAAGGKGGDGAGVDLNGLLAQFLPKGEDESAHRSILDSVAFGGNRNIANEEAPSYLDKNADLFQRIHETMSEKNRRGQLGI